MEKHQTEKIRKIKAIPDRRIDFYYRLLNGPEQLKKRKKQRITAALVIAAFLAAGHVLGVLKHSEKEYQKTIGKYTFDANAKNFVLSAASMLSRYADYNI